MWRALAAGCWCLSAAAFAADNVAVLTILEGNATLVRDTSRYQLAEGARLNDEDIVELGPDAFVQIEFGDGVRLGAGPATRLQIGPRLAKEKTARPGRFYLLSGWSKVTPAGKEVSYAGAQADLAHPGVTVGQAGPENLQVFVETQDAKVTDRRAGNTVTLRNGEFYSRKGGDRGTVAGRPPAEFLTRLPRPFRDSLPPRAERFKDRPAQLRQLGTIGYDDVAPWLQGEQALRRQFLTRWRPLANDAAFRASLASNMKAHPEWDRIVFPEKYLPKKPSPPKPAIAPGPAAAPPVPAASVPSAVPDSGR